MELNIKKHNIRGIQQLRIPFCQLFPTNKTPHAFNSASQSGYLSQSSGFLVHVQRENSTFSLIKLVLPPSVEAKINKIDWAQYLQTSFLREFFFCQRREYNLQSLTWAEKSILQKKNNVTKKKFCCATKRKQLF